MCNKSNISTDIWVGVPENTFIEKNKISKFSLS